MAIWDLKTRLRAKLTRRHSTASSLSSADGEAHRVEARANARSLQSRGSFRPPSTARGGATIQEDEGHGGGVVGDETESAKLNVADREVSRQLRLISLQGSDLLSQNTSPSKKFHDNIVERKHDSSSTVEFPTPTTDIPPVIQEYDGENEAQQEPKNVDAPLNSPSSSPSPSKNPTQRPSELPRRQSLLPPQQTRLIKTLLETQLPPQSGTANLDYFAHNGPATISANMVSRKIWVKRGGGSATLVTIHEDDLVDDVREMILKKYANSLGRCFDAPDLTLRIIPREQRQERVLGPEEPMGRTLDAYFPGGQMVDEALVIDVPPRRTPRPSPRTHGVYYEDLRPAEAGSDYFPPMPVPNMPSPHLPNSVPVGANAQGASHHAGQMSHAISVLTTGLVPALPSPGTTRRHHRERPRVGRQHASSPTVTSGHPQTPTASNEQSSAPPSAPPLPPPLAQQQDILQIQRVATPPPQIVSPRPSNRPKKPKKAAVDHPSLPTGMLNVAVPPINVLIVEDNIINLKLLEAFMKRLKVRWQSAMNGREAVTKWRAGGFHLVLMDIQLPIMSGLEATKEIRRLEGLNSIGFFSSSASSSAPEKAAEDEPEGDDKLPNTMLFKSPVIIVALTASSLQSDRHEALAAGCNDFLTKPVNFVWLERMVMEWGCMQALIDFDGWRKWKDFSQGIKEDEKGDAKGGKGVSGAGSKKKKGNRNSLTGNVGASTSRTTIREDTEPSGAAELGIGLSGGREINQLA